MFLGSSIHQLASSIVVRLRLPFFPRFRAAPPPPPCAACCVGLHCLTLRLGAGSRLISYFVCTFIFVCVFVSGIDLASPSLREVNGDPRAGENAARSRVPSFLPYFTAANVHTFPNCCGWQLYMMGRRCNRYGMMGARKALPYCVVRCCTPCPSPRSVPIHACRPTTPKSKCLCQGIRASLAGRRRTATCWTHHRPRSGAAARGEVRGRDLSVRVRVYVCVAFYIRLVARRKPWWGRRRSRTAVRGGTEVSYK
ncbi:hypothetical protein PLESTM_000677000 [Pleodorina starrii]|nr:hypothetical protein PLESTM_000677000 [Pleodorina starrii]